MYIAIEGVIGVGKTTLARMLQPRFEAELQLEVFEENPFLADFYSDRERYAFQTQIFFLLSRYHQQRKSVKEMVKNGTHLITDYTFAKDALFASINLNGDELEMYYRVHEALGEKVLSEKALSEKALGQKAGGEKDCSHKTRSQKAGGQNGVETRKRGAGCGGQGRSESQSRRAGGRCETGGESAQCDQGDPGRDHGSG